MRPFRVVVFSPAFDDDLGFSQRVEDLPVQQFVPEPGIEALDVAILPGAARLDEGGLGTNSLNPGPDILSNELRSIVAADKCWRPAQDEQIRQGVDDVRRVQPALHQDCQAFPAELVEDVQCAERLAIIRAAMDEVVAPDMVPIFWSETDT